MPDVAKLVGRGVEMLGVLVKGAVVGNDPSVKGNQLNLWAEVIDVYQSGTFELTSVLRDVPQLLD